MRSPKWYPSWSNGFSWTKPVGLLLCAGENTRQKGLGEGLLVLDVGWVVEPQKAAGSRRRSSH